MQDALSEPRFRRMLDGLLEWLRIPSISSGGGDPRDLLRAAEWAAQRIEVAGGSADIETNLGNPLVVGELRARRPTAPAILIYGHYDVQSPDPVELWTTPPFEPTIRDGRLYARGASDDKGNFFPLLFEACELAGEDELPVHVRVLIEGEEETAGRSALEWLRGDDRGAACSIVFDSDMLDAATPALTLGVRGIVQVGVEVRASNQDLHSGMYGGVALNASHVLHRILGEVLPGPDGRLRAELRAGVTPPTAEELQEWSELPPGGDVLARAGARPISAAAAAEYYARTWADASLDVHGLASGDAVQVRTMIPATASAKLSLRLAAGQSSAEMAPVLTALLERAVPPGADATVQVLATGEPAVFDPRAPALRLAAEALEEACARPPALTRVGGSLPLLAALAERGIPAVVTGFALAEDAIHAPNESFRLESLRLGLTAARALYLRLAHLDGS